MNNHELIQFLRDQVQNVKATGSHGISFDDLDDYFVRLQKSLENLPPELQNIQPLKVQHEFSLAQYNWQKDQALEMFRSVIATGQAALKASMLMNGGAAVALLAFIGHAAAIPSTQRFVSQFAWPLFLFVLGVFSSGLAAGVTYLTQHLYNRGCKNSGRVLNVLASLFGGASFLFFCYASYLAYGVFLKM